MEVLNVRNVLPQKEKKHSSIHLAVPNPPHLVLLTCTTLLALIEFVIRNVFPHATPCGNSFLPLRKMFTWVLTKKLSAR